VEEIAEEERARRGERERGRAANRAHTQQSRSIDEQRNLYATQHTHKKQRL
jgi:hypothetical protein